jgi:hypothetical protein
LNKIIGKLNIEDWDSSTQPSPIRVNSRPMPQNSLHRFTSSNHAPCNILSVDQAMFDRVVPTCLVKNPPYHRDRVAFDFDIKKEWKTAMSPGIQFPKKLPTSNSKVTTTTTKTKIAVIPLVHSPTQCVLSTPTRPPSSSHSKARRVFRDPGLPKQDLYL